MTEGKDISMLINNVEEKDPYGKKIHKADDKEVLDCLTINTFPIAFMSRYFGPDLKARTDKKSAIVNITSYYG